MEYNSGVVIQYGDIYAKSTKVSIAPSGSYHVAHIEFPVTVLSADLPFALFDSMLNHESLSDLIVISNNIKMFGDSLKSVEVNVNSPGGVTCAVEMTCTLQQGQFTLPASCMDRVIGYDSALFGMTLGGAEVLTGDEVVSASITFSREAESMVNVKTNFVTLPGTKFLKPEPHSVLFGYRARKGIFQNDRVVVIDNIQPELYASWEAGMGSVLYTGFTKLRVN
jgi:hypothetical protein